MTVVSIAAPTGDGAFFDLDERVRLEVLDDPAARVGPAARLARRVLRAVPSLLLHPDEPRAERMSAWRDWLLIRRLRAADGIVVGTRAGVCDAMVRCCRPAAVLVGQEHVPLDSYSPALRGELATTYPRLHALQVLTAPAADHARALLGRTDTHLAVVGNALPPLDGPAPRSTRRHGRS